MRVMKSVLLNKAIVVLIAMTISSCCTISGIFSPNNLPPGCSPPAAAFSASQTTISEGSSVTYTDQSTGRDITDRTWEYPGGTPSSSTDKNPVVTYNLAGTYPVTLRVTNNRGTDTETKSEFITVLRKLDANFSAEPRKIRSGDKVTFTDNSKGDNIVSRKWTFEGGSPSTSNATSPQVVYNNPGTYRVSLEIKNSINEMDVERKTGFVIVEDGNQVITYEPPSINRQCPTHIEGDEDFKEHGPDVKAWVNLRVEGNKRVYADYYLSARETRSDWTTAEGRWSKLLWTAGQGQSIVQINSDMRSETSYRDTDHALDRPSISGGTLVKKFEIMGDTGGNDVNRCTADDVYMNIHFNPIKIQVRNN
jgi:PKD repeat protein